MSSFMTNTYGNKLLVESWDPNRINPVVIDGKGILELAARNPDVFQLARFSTGFDPNRDLNDPFTFEFGGY